MSAPTVAPSRPLSWRVAIYPFALLILANLLWSSNWIVGRAVHESMPPVALSFWRWCVAALVLAPLALPRLKGQWHLVWRDRGLILLLGVTGIATPQCLTYIGLNYTTVLNGSLLNAAVPFVMVLTAWLIDRHSATRRQWLGMALSFVGALLIVARGNLATLWDFRFNPGDLLIVSSMPIWCVYSVLLRRRPRQIDGLAFLFVLIPIGLAALSPALAYEAIYVRTPIWSWSLAVEVVYVGISASAAAYILWNRGVELIGPNRASFTNPFQPVFAAFLAIVLLGEEFHAYHAIGFAVIVCGWYLTSGLRIRA